jgi:hypothetical protein
MAGELTRRLARLDSAANAQAFREGLHGAASAAQVVAGQPGVVGLNPAAVTDAFDGADRPQTGPRTQAVLERHFLGVVRSQAHRDALLPRPGEPAEHRAVRDVMDYHGAPLPAHGH